MIDVYNDATYWEVDTALLESMTEEFAKVYNVATDEAAKLALENINLNAGLEDLVGSYKDWKEILE